MIAAASSYRFGSAGGFLENLCKVKWFNLEVTNVWTAFSGSLAILHE